VTDAPTAHASTPLRRTSVALIGGFRAAGRLRLGDRLVRIAAIGGVDLDLADAEFEAPRLTIVKVSLIGGLKLRVPAGARVEVHGFALGGRTVESGGADPGPGTAPSAAPTIVVHAYGLIGGIKVRRR
jgi:hypothetical protein